MNRGSVFLLSGDVYKCKFSLQILIFFFYLSSLIWQHGVPPILPSSLPLLSAIDFMNTLFMIYWIILFPLHFNHRDDICWQQYTDALSEYILRFVNAYCISMTKLRFCLFHLQYKKWDCYYGDEKCLWKTLCLSVTNRWNLHVSCSFLCVTCCSEPCITELILSSCFHWYEG